MVCSKSSLVSGLAGVPFHLERISHKNTRERGEKTYQIVTCPPVGIWVDQAKGALSLEEVENDDELSSGDGHSGKKSVLEPKNAEWCNYLIDLKVLP